MNTLDSRDLQHELDQLEAEQSDDCEGHPAGPNDPMGETVYCDGSCKPSLLDEEDTVRLNALRELAEEVGGDWHYGVQLIPETDFEDYARELAEETGALDNGPTHWPFTAIDWERAAHDLATDYSSVEFDGVTYLYRA